MEARKPILRHHELDVFRIAFDGAMEIFLHSKNFPTMERYSLTDQIRRSSRSVCTNITEAWRKRRYEAAFISKLSDAEAEAAETQTWVQFCVKCGYLDRSIGDYLDGIYNHIIAMLVNMLHIPKPWLVKNSRATEDR